MMSHQPKITRQQIKSRTTTKSFDRGLNYYNNGAIMQMVRRDDKIEARCQGSYPEPYRVSATFNDVEIVATSCNCEYDWGGDCKHIVAMLLAYESDPSQFEELATLHESLHARTKDDLIDIIISMINRVPDLQEIVDRPTTSEIVEGRVTLNTLSYRQELSSVFSIYDHYDEYNGYGQYGTSPDAKVYEIIAVAQRFAQKKDWYSATNIYRVILEEFAEMDIDYYYDEDGELAEAINTTVDKLDTCLAQPQVSADAEERLASLEALFGVVVWDSNYGGIDIGYNAPDVILKHIQQEDIASFRKLIKQARKRGGQWANQFYAEFLTHLDVLDEIDPEVILKRLYDEGMDLVLVKRLLDMNRLDEALKVIREDMAYANEWQQALRVLRDKGHKEHAQQLAEERLAQEYNFNLANWLLGTYKIDQKQADVLRWEHRLFQEQPSITSYHPLKATAHALGQWDDLYPELIKHLKTKSEYITLTKVYLEEQEWELAWETQSKVDNNHYWARFLDLEVAKASYHAMPDHAIPVLIRHARESIDLRGRDNYATAAELLSHVLQAYDQNGNIDQWEALINEIRETHKRLPALQDELNKAGL